MGAIMEELGTSNSADRRKGEVHEDDKDSCNSEVAIPVEPWRSVRSMHSATAAAEASAAASAAAIAAALLGDAGYLRFKLREGEALLTSKGEPHSFDEVGGRTYVTIAADLTNGAIV